MKERLNKVTKGQGRVTIPFPQGQSPASLGINALYLQLKRRDYGLSCERFEILTIIFTMGKSRGIAASSICTLVTNLPGGKTAAMTAIQMKLTWLYRNGWVNRLKHDRWFYYTPAKKAIDFFKVEKPAA